MIVEFLGLPSSGKSTLVNALLTKLASDGWNHTSLEALERKNVKIKPILRKNAIARHSYRRDQIDALYPDFNALANGVLARFPQQKAMFIQGLTEYVIAEEMSRDVGLVCMHEGPWHRLLYGLSNAPDFVISDALESLSDYAAPDAVAHLCATPEQSLEGITNRMRKRNVANPERKAIQRHGSIAKLQNRNDMMQAAVDYLSSKGTKVVKLEAFSPLDEMLSELYGSLDLSSARVKTYV
ncbi:hypothetical protein J7394_18990 [Ruegeria sp. R13_0]|uniref:hypothetical protein n=1 Tax=Ruegeria sp. R13_0 TaxID=2821099 RepID=UPI001ADB7E31|nr:hypothetical protein [Ruegeria sp. R13_0]MBO9436313.1 hypothetical protein [Ruegeria sp. R13_0]